MIEVWRGERSICRYLICGTWDIMSGRPEPIHQHVSGQAVGQPHRDLLAQRRDLAGNKGETAGCKRQEQKGRGR